MCCDNKPLLTQALAEEIRSSLTWRPRYITASAGIPSTIKGSTGLEEFRCVEMWKVVDVYKTPGIPVVVRGIHSCYGWKPGWHTTTRRTYKPEEEYTPSRPRGFHVFWDFFRANREMKMAARAEWLWVPSEERWWRRLLLPVWCPVDDLIRADWTYQAVFKKVFVDSSPFQDLEATAQNLSRQPLIETGDL